MTKKMVLLAAIALLLPCMAMASGVSFTTTGTFSNPSLFPDLTFAGVNDSNLNANPPLGDNTTFGKFTLSACTKGSGVCGGKNASETFTLTITQTTPTGGTGPLIGTISGTVTKSQGNLVLTFTTATVTIGEITYSLPVPSETLNFAKSGATTTLNGFVLNPVPEPSARLMLALSAIGLAGLTLVSRKFVNA